MPIDWKLSSSDLNRLESTRSLRSIIIASFLSGATFDGLISELDEFVRFRVVLLPAADRRGFGGAPLNGIIFITVTELVVVVSGDDELVLLFGVVVVVLFIDNVEAIDELEWNEEPFESDLHTDVGFVDRVEAEGFSPPWSR